MRSNLSLVPPILTLDRAVNQRFLAQEAAVKISGSSHGVERKCVGVLKWYMQMPTWDTGSLNLSINLGVSACGQKRFGQSRRASIVVERPTVSLRLSTPPRLRSRSAKCGLEDYTAWYGQEKKKLWVNIAVCLGLSLSLSPSLTVSVSLTTCCIVTTMTNYINT